MEIHRRFHFYERVMILVCLMFVRLRVCPAPRNHASKKAAFGKLIKTAERFFVAPHPHTPPFGTPSWLIACAGVHTRTRIYSGILINQEQREHFLKAMNVNVNAITLPHIVYLRTRHSHHCPALCACRLV